MVINQNTALVIVDPQPTFMPGGELAVPGGDSIVPVIIAFLRKHGHKFKLIVLSRDWHPKDHFSFAKDPQWKDGSWPAHGIMNTPTAQVHPDIIAVLDELELPYVIISKGMDKDVEAYSAFDGINLHTRMTLEEELRFAGIDEVVECGLAGEVCVLASMLASLEIGYPTTLFEEATGFLGDAEPALAVMREAGAKFVATSKDFS